MGHDQDKSLCVYRARVSTASQGCGHERDRCKRDRCADRRPRRLARISRQRRSPAHPLGPPLTQPDPPLPDLAVPRSEGDRRAHGAAAGAGIVYYNHIHWLDPVLITGRLHRYAVPLTKIEAQPLAAGRLAPERSITSSSSPAGWSTGRRSRRPGKSWRTATSRSSRPKALAARTAQLQTAKEGLAFVAQQAPDCWLIPAAVTGTPDFRFKAPADQPAAGQHHLRPAVSLPLAAGGRRRRWRCPKAGRAARSLREMTDEAMGELARCLPDECAARMPTRSEQIAGGWSLWTDKEVRRAQTLHQVDRERNSAWARPPVDRAAR